jgi:hypothetical protein
MTLMLGTASAALAVVVFAVSLMAIRAVTASRWYEPRTLGSGGTIYQPSSYTLGLGFIGLVLGVLGAILSRRLRKLSWSSVFGVALIVLTLWVPIIYELIVTILR